MQKLKLLSLGFGFVSFNGKFCSGVSLFICYTFFMGHEQFGYDTSIKLGTALQQCRNEVIELSLVKKSLLGQKFEFLTCFDLARESALPQARPALWKGQVMSES